MRVWGMHKRKTQITSLTTVAHWWGEEIQFNEVPINTEKRESFMLYVDLPSQGRRSNWL
jgi:hypothetical protein